MAVYEYEGKFYDLPDGLSNDQALAKIRGAVGGGDASYIAEALRKGPASTAGLAVGLANLTANLAGTITADSATPTAAFFPVASILQPALGTGYEIGQRLMGQTPNQPPTQAFTQGRERAYQGVMRALGSTGAEPQTVGQKIVAGGLQAATSPESYLFPPIAAVRRLGLFGQAAARPAEQAIVGSGAEAGGEAGAYAGAKVGSETAGRILGGVVGGGGTAYALGDVTRAGPVMRKGFDVLKGQWNKVAGTVPENEVFKEVDRRISNIFNAAIEADPNIAKTIEEAISAQQSVSLKAPGAAAVQLPLSAILANNPVIDEQIRKLSSQNSLFRAQYGAQYEAAKAALTQNQLRLFGDPSKAVVTAVGPDLAKVQAQRIKSLDEQIADAYKGQSIDPNTFGQRITNLIEKKEAAARASTKPLYQEAFDIAKAKNLELPAASVDDIFNFVAGERASDVFKTFPTIYNRVSQRFKPTTTGGDTTMVQGVEVAMPQQKAFAAATIEDLDSLKREINRQLSKSKDSADIRLLSELKRRVSGHIDSLDPDFVTAYRNADNAYFQRVGLPFDSATLAAVDRKKFVEQVAPAIIGNKSNVSDFITATGEQGVNLVRSAFVDAFSTAALKNDVLDPKAAAKWLKKNEGGVSLVPGLREELEGATRNVQGLIDARTRLNADFQRVAGEQIISAQGVRSPQELVTKMYGDVKFTNKFMQQYGADKDSVNAVRAFMLDDIVRAGDPAAMLSDRNRAAVFNRVFGPTYAQKVLDFATTTQRLSVDPTRVAFRTDMVPKTVVEEVTGSSPEQIASRVFNPVSGALYAVTSTFSKFWARQAARQTEAKLIDLLSNPTDAVQLMTALEKSKKGISPEDLLKMADIGRKYGIDWAKETATNITSGAARGAVQQSQE